jgi:hypothetical protein
MDGKEPLSLIALTVTSEELVYSTVYSYSVAGPALAPSIPSLVFEVISQHIKNSFNPEFLSSSAIPQ